MLMQCGCEVVWKWNLFIYKVLFKLHFRQLSWTCHGFISLAFEKTKIVVNDSHVGTLPNVRQHWAVSDSWKWSSLTISPWWKDSNCLSMLQWLQAVIGSSLLNAHMHLVSVLLAQSAQMQWCIQLSPLAWDVSDYLLSKWYWFDFVHFN